MSRFLGTAKRDRATGHYIHDVSGRRAKAAEQADSILEHGIGDEVEIKKSGKKARIVGITSWKDYLLEGYPGLTFPPDTVRSVK